MAYPRDKTIEEQESLSPRSSDLAKRDFIAFSLVRRNSGTVRNTALESHLSKH
jgi:hypothetical protein